MSAIWPDGRSRWQWPAWRGLTLLELMVVLLIAGLATALSLLALPDPPARQLQQDAQRLAAWLENGRAASRAHNEVLRWRTDENGFRWEGRAGGPSGGPWPRQWLHDSTQAQVLGASELLLGPEPVIGPQGLILSHRLRPQLQLWVATDGIGPFEVMGQAPAPPARP